MSKALNEYQYKRQKLQVKAYAFLCLILLIGGGIYSYQKWQTYSSLKTGFQTNIANADAISKSSNEEQTAYDSQKESFNAMSEKIGLGVSEIFPPEDYYTELAKKLEEIEQGLHKKTNPFEISNLSFEQPSKIVDHSVLPFSMTIKSTYPNFMKFLRLIETSGALENGVRLMDINSIRLSFEAQGDDETSKDKMINFNVQLNAYFQ